MGGILRAGLMRKSHTNRFNDDDYLAEPNYNHFTDEELDELYYFGELRSAAKKRKAARKSQARKINSKPPSRFVDDDWLDFDIDGANELYLDD